MSANQTPVNEVTQHWTARPDLQVSMEVTSTEPLTPYQYALLREVAAKVEHFLDLSKTEKAEKPS